MLTTPVHEEVGLVLTPSMAGMTACPRFRLPLDGDETTAGEQHSADFSQSGVDVPPVVHGGDRPHDRSGAILQRDRLDDAFDIRHPRRVKCQQPSDTKHDRRRIDSNDGRAQPCRVADSTPGPHPMSTTVSPEHRSLRRAASRASPFRPNAMLSAAMSPATPAKPG